MTRRVIEVAAVVIRRRGMVLLASRPEGKPPAGWEFPGGKLERGESLQNAAERELMEELGLAVLAFDELYRIRLEPPAATLILRFVRGLERGAGEPFAREGQRFGWFDLAQPPPPDLLAADREVWDFLSIKS